MRYEKQKNKKKTEENQLEQHFQWSPKLDIVSFWE